MGKRGAVRKESGLPVRQSGSELGVGPGTPNTSGRNSEACPPDSGAGSQPAPLSQRKTGREPEGGAFGGLQGAEAPCRCEAPQAVCSTTQPQKDTTQPAASSTREASALNLFIGNNCSAEVTPKPTREAFKVWKKPEGVEEGPRFQGDYFPPSGGPLFTPADLAELGFTPGNYVIRIPRWSRQECGSPPWQEIEVFQCN